MADKDDDVVELLWEIFSKVILACFAISLVVRFAGEDNMSNLLFGLFCGAVGFVLCLVAKDEIQAIFVKVTAAVWTWFDKHNR